MRLASFDSYPLTFPNSPRYLVRCFARSVFKVSYVQLSTYPFRHWEQNRKKNNSMRNKLYPVVQWYSKRWSEARMVIHHCELSASADISMTLPLESESNTQPQNHS